MYLPLKLRYLFVEQWMSSEIRVSFYRRNRRFARFFDHFRILNGLHRDVRHAGLGLAEELARAAQF